MVDVQPPDRKRPTGSISRGPGDADAITAWLVMDDAPDVQLRFARSVPGEGPTLCRRGPCQADPDLHVCDDRDEHEVVIAHGVRADVPQRSPDD